MKQLIYSDLPGLEQQTGYMEIGKSAVWQCSSRTEFLNYVLPYAILNNRQYLIKYLCFGNQTPYSVNKDDVMTYFLNADAGFESFTFQLYHIISTSPPNTIFLFDFLSELQTSWVSDMMMANFFRIICPILSEVKSTGIFPLLRNQHSYPALYRIIQTADIFFDIQYREQFIRVESLHFHNTQNYLPVRYYCVQQNPLSFSRQEQPDVDFVRQVIDKESPDIWDRYFREFENLAKADRLTDQAQQTICLRLMTQEEKMKAMITEHFTPSDYISIYERLIGSGKIGGKACGFLLGRKLIETFAPDAFGQIEPNDTYFIGTDVFYSYMVENNCWPYRLKHRLEQDHFDEIEPFRTAISEGSFPSYIKKQFCRMLIHYGNTPIIVRSSSFLEDGFGNAFSGKYESIFCPNQGPLKERLAQLEAAIKTVYTSTLSSSALEYRKKRRLLGLDEQMALLVQKVSGSRHGDLYFPLAAGVSFSYNPYRWMEQISPEAGMVRLVAGMGTRAVNRTPGDYPRLIGLDRPQAKLYATTQERHKFSQRQIDVLNLSTGQIESKPFEQIIDLIPANYQKLIFSHDTEAEARLQEQGRYRTVYFTDCQGIVNNTQYIKFMKRILPVLEQAYQSPIDIEFALTVRDDGSLGVDLLQCRPLQHSHSQEYSVRQYEQSDVLFKIKQASMRQSKKELIDLIVLIDPRRYYETAYNNKRDIATAIGSINHLINNRNAMLLVPGRIGTSSPELGVPVTYAEVSEFKVICEVAFSAAGYNPELSYGSHMFQDLVEADVFYAAIHENRQTKLYQPNILLQYPNQYDTLFPDRPEYREIIHICDLTEQPAQLYLDSVHGEALCLIAATGK